jgi:hypothetical protein
MIVVGWMCVVGSASFAWVVRQELAEVPTWGIGEISGGIIDVFLPSPQAIAMVLWEFAHLWILVVGLALLRAKVQHVALRPRDRVVTMSMVASLLAAGLLFGALGRQGVTMGVPGIDHSWGWWRR